MNLKPKTVSLGRKKFYRLVASKYPPIQLFENLVDANDLKTLYYIEGLTNQRIREVIGDLNLIPKKEWLTGPGSSVVMAAFTHIGRTTRFSNGSYGVYYGGLSIETALVETIYHREKFLARTNEKTQEIDMRSYINHAVKPLHDIRNKKNKSYAQLHNPNDYKLSQEFGKTMRANDSNGILYRSARNNDGECIAAFKPTAVSIPVQGPHYALLWDGITIKRYYKKSHLHNL